MIQKLKLPYIQFWTELSLIGISCAVVSTAGQILTSNHLLLFVVTISTHLFLLFMRRLKVKAPINHSLSFIFLILLEIYLGFPETLRYGLPTLGSFESFLSSVNEALLIIGGQAFPITGGFDMQVLLSLFVLIIINLSVWSAFVNRQTGFTLIPYMIILFFFLFIGPREQSLLDATLLAITTASFVLLHKIMLQPTTTKIREKINRTGFTKLYKIHLSTGLTVAVLAIVIGTSVGPILPGVRSEPIINLSRETVAPNSRSRTILNPLVDIRDSITSTIDNKVFRVKTNNPTYWKTITLNDFNGTIWSFEDTYSSLGEGKNENLPLRKELSVETKHSFEILSLGGIEVPNAYLPILGTIKEKTDGLDLLYNSETSSLITSRNSLQLGDTYDINSLQLVKNQNRLLEISKTEKEYPAYTSAYTNLPDSFPQEITLLAQKVTSSGTSPYQKALLLEKWFTSSEFKYSESVPKGHSENAMINFIKAKEGFCEQFSGTFAAMTRALGIPSRVSIGFTNNEYGASGEQTIVVSSKDAHAWPEIYIPKVGWVILEPTPGRGINASNESSSSQSTTPATSPATSPPTSTSTTPTPTTSPTPETTPDTQQPSVSETVDPEQKSTLISETTVSETKSSSLSIFFLFGLLLLALFFGLYLFAINYSKKVSLSLSNSFEKLSPTEFTYFAWLLISQKLSWFGISRNASETRLDFSERASKVLGIKTRELKMLANSTNEAHYSNNPPSSATKTKESAEAINKELENRLTGFKKILKWINPKPTFKLIMEKRRLKGSY